MPKIGPNPFIESGVSLSSVGWSGDRTGRLEAVKEVGADPGHLRISYTAHGIDGSPLHPEVAQAVRDAIKPFMAQAAE